MQKSDLKSGNVVTLRDGSKSIVILGVETEGFCGDAIVSLRGHKWGKLSEYNEDLTAKGFECSDYDFTKLDIVKVEKITHPVYLIDYFKK